MKTRHHPKDPTLIELYPDADIQDVDLLVTLRKQGALVPDAIVGRTGRSPLVCRLDAWLRNRHAVNHEPLDSERIEVPRPKTDYDRLPRERHQAETDVAHSLLRRMMGLDAPAQPQPHHEPNQPH